MPHGYSIAYGHTKEHAAALKRGLLALPGFLAHICGACDGEGQSLQHYNAGCGAGMVRMMGGCDWCDGMGLRQGDKPAPVSVVNQVLQAGSLVEKV